MKWPPLTRAGLLLCLSKPLVDVFPGGGQVHWTCNEVTRSSNNICIERTGTLLESSREIYLMIHQS